MVDDDKDVVAALPEVRKALKDYNYAIESLIMLSSNLTHTQKTTLQPYLHQGKVALQRLEEQMPKEYPRRIYRVSGDTVPDGAQDMSLMKMMGEMDLTEEEFDAVVFLGVDETWEADRDTLKVTRMEDVCP